MTSAIDAALAAARNRISTVDANTAAQWRDAGGVLVDTRPGWQRDQFGRVDGAVIVERNHLEWRLDPTSEHRLRDLDDRTGPIVVFCQEGYASSLAVASLTDIGVADVHDLSGGFAAWVAAGLPIVDGA